MIKPSIDPSEVRFFNGSSNLEREIREWGEYPSGTMYREKNRESIRVIRKIRAIHFENFLYLSGNQP